MGVRMAGGPGRTIEREWEGVVNGGGTWGVRSRLET
jgi:hypothetical protein